jgi:putative colanic acid biosysnthesis UDP-glucose lipid carrier transferase
MNYSKYLPLISILGDFILLNLIFVFGFIYYDGTPVSQSPQYLAFYLYLNVIWLVLVFVFGAHTIDRNTQKRSMFFTYVNIIVFFFFLFMIYSQISVFPYYNRKWYKYIFPAYFFLLMAWKFSLYYALMYYRKKGFNFRTVIILGVTEGTERLRTYFTDNHWHGYRFLGFFDDRKNADEKVIGSWDDLKPFIEANHVDEIYLAWNGIPSDKLGEISDLISEYPVKVRIVPNLGNFMYKTAQLIPYGALPVIQIHPGPLSHFHNRLIKRFFDLVVSLTVILTVLPPVTLLLYLADRFGAREGVFFKQKRTRIDGRVFYCIKYRSMRSNAEADTLQATRGDSRITPLGRILRKYSIDELPQFINVFLGHMSVVGPRPHMLRHTDEYRRQIRRFMLRHTVKPGLTGLAQIRGYRGEIHSVEDIQHRVEMDVNYIENWSFGLDLKIIINTFRVLFKGG